jgi:methylase of polypeptide subunit release factors
VNARASAAGRVAATSLRDVFGWSRPFAPDLLPPRIAGLALQARVLVDEAPLLRSLVRVSTREDRAFLHSSYPTEGAHDVFFGPDTYRYCDLIEQELQRGARARRVVDVGCGSGAGGLVAAAHADRVVLADVNHRALAFARANTAIAKLEGRAEIVESDVLAGVDGPFDVVLANPPYMADGACRAYRDGGGQLGEGLSIRIAREALARLEPGGRLILYTGVAIVDGRDACGEALARICSDAGATWSYRMLDPDVFGEEIEHNDAYASVERIAAVALVATVR